MPKRKDYLSTFEEEDLQKFAEYLAFHLFRKVKGLTQEHCEDIAIAILEDFKVEKPEWWDKKENV